MIKGKTVAAITLGCKVNQYETDSMLELLSEMGAIIVEPSQKADIYIINTCSVTNMADRKSRQMIHRAKKQNPESLIVAVGCYVQAEREKLETDENIDIIISNNRKKEIGVIICDYLSNKRELDNFTDISAEQEYEALSLSHTITHTRAYVKIQDGCNQFCSYCIIPYVRGRIRSRQPEAIVEEIEKLSDSGNGAKEVILTGIHISSYGMDKENGIGLLELIKRISKIKSIERIRLGSLEPTIITEDFVRELSSMDKVCPHFHLSLQSGCNSVLKRMNRKYTCEQYLEKCDLLRRYYDRPALTTDVIVGFPGETEEEFEETLRYLTELKLYEMHIFKYSPRKGTVAASMPNPVKPEIKDKRSEILIACGAKNKALYEEQFKGETLSVLVEEIVEKAGKSYLRGHTERYMDVLIDCQDMEKPEDCINKILPYTYIG